MAKSGSRVGNGLMVYQRLRYAIAHGVFEPGQRITERDIAERLEVSRTPVREALHRLAQEGLIHGGAGTWRIASVTVEDAEKLYEVRGLILGRAAELAASQRTTKDLEEMQANLKTSERMIAEGNVHGVSEANNAFHAIIMRASHNAYLEEVLDLLSAKVSVTMFLSLSNSHRPEQALSEHIGLYDAITAGNWRRAGALARSHSQNSLESVKKGILIFEEKQNLLSRSATTAFNELDI